MNYQLLQGDCIEVMRTLPAGSVQCCVTSPPYFGLRAYLDNADPNKPLEVGTEETPDAYVAKLVDVFREVRRLLRDDGVLWLNLGDSYANTGNPGQDFSASTVGYGGKGRGHLGGQPKKIIPTGIKQKDLFGIPWLVAFALRADGWWLRSEVIWAKKAPRPESVTDRPTKAHEQVFLLTKSANYFYDADAIAEPAQVWTGQAATFARSGPVSDHILPGQSAAQHRSDRTDSVTASTRNRRSVWSLGPESYQGAHFATMPTKLVEPCILAGSRVGDTVLDPFAGSGTTVAVALKHGRRGLGIDLNPAYIELAHERIRRTQPMLLAAD